MGLRPIGEGKRLGARHVGNEARKPKQRHRARSVRIGKAKGYAALSALAHLQELRFLLVHRKKRHAPPKEPIGMAKVTILQVVPRLDTGGSEQATVEIADALTRAGASALVATEGGRLATDVTQAGGEVIELPVASKNPFTILANVRRLQHLVEERG